MRIFEVSADTCELENFIDFMQDKFIGWQLTKFYKDNISAVLIFRKID